MRGGAQSIQSAINILFANRALLEDAFSLRCTVVLVRLQPHKCLSEKRKSLTENVVGPLPLAAVVATHRSLAAAAHGGQRKRPTDRSVYRPPSRLRQLQPMRPEFFGRSKTEPTLARAASGSSLPQFFVSRLGREADPGGIWPRVSPSRLEAPGVP